MCSASQLLTPTGGGKRDGPMSIPSACVEVSSEGRWAPCDFQGPPPEAQPSVLPHSFSVSGL